MWFWLFLASTSVVVFMFLYIRWLLSSLAVINTDVENVSVAVQDFATHLGSVYELEVFYGDETLKSLIGHSNELISTLNNLDLLLDENKNEKEEKIAEETTT